MATNAAPDPDRDVEPASLLSGQPVAPAPAKPRKLSEDLALILREFEVETVTLREVMAVLHGRGYVLLVMLLALPFATPIPLPGLSTPFGLVIALIGLRLSLGQKPWLPARLLDTGLSPRLFKKVFAAAHKILRGFEYLLKPRLLWLTGSARLLQVHAIPIFFAAVMLLLPLPVPFSNILPAFSVLLFSAGLLERDGLFIFAGYVVFFCALAFFVGIGLAGAEGFDAFKRWLDR
jgi:hypothetical protein